MKCYSYLINVSSLKKQQSRFVFEIYNTYSYSSWCRISVETLPLEQTARDVGLHRDSNKMVFMYFKQEADNVLMLKTFFFII